MNERKMATSLKLAAKQSALGYAFVAIAAGFAFYDLSHSNRPHELRFEWVAGILLLLGVVVGLFVLWSLRSAWRARGSGEFRARLLVPMVVAVGYCCLLLVPLALVAWGIVRNMLP